MTDPAPGLFLRNRWLPGEAEPFISVDPSTPGDPAWEGRAASSPQVDAAVSAARAAFPAWADTPLDERAAILQRYADLLAARTDDLVTAIGREAGKPRWEAATEVKAMIGKVTISLEAHHDRCDEFAGGPAVTRFKPHGVVAVLGPFNFPGHLPNGHLVPALLAGNTAVFKPSEHGPSVAALMADAFRDAGLPEGVLGVVQGQGETGKALAGHPGIDGLFFTGSARTGEALHRLYAAQPQKILALEMGGNNPLVVWDAADHEAAALLTIQSAFLTAGQRCTCARRLIIPADDRGNAFLEALLAWTQRILVGAPTVAREPFMGPVITHAAAVAVVKAYEQRCADGGRGLLAPQLLKARTGLVSPGIVDVTHVADLPDEEVFGPLLQVIRVPSFDAALTTANDTAYGLAAGLLSDREELYRRFQREVRAGIINWNQQLTGASSAAPFGGIGRSGNHRPSAYLAADYCSYPVASIEKTKLVCQPDLIKGLA